MTEILIFSVLLPIAAGALVGHLVYKRGLRRHLAEKPHREQSNTHETLV
jgi:hypothetical protein